MRKKQIVFNNACFGDAFSRIGTKAFVKFPRKFFECLPFNTAESTTERSSFSGIQNSSFFPIGSGS
jgi:hypothetical protein